MASSSRPFKRTKSTAQRIREVPNLEFSNENFVKNFATRGIIDGKFVLFDEMYGLDIEEKFVALGWKIFLNIRENVYPRLVRAFYGNMTCSYEEGPELEVTLKHKTICLNAEALGDILGLRTEGIAVHNIRTWSFDREQMATVIFENNGRTPSKISASTLPLKHRLIHRIISTNILPRMGHKDEVSFTDLHILYCILTGTSTNLPYTIIQKMMDMAGSSKKGYLPYGMVLTKIFKAFDIPLDDEPGILEYKHHHAFGSQIIKKMGFELVHGRWVEQQQPQQQQAPAPNESDEEDEIARIETQFTAGEERITIRQLYEHQQKMSQDIAALQTGQQEILSILRNLQLGGSGSTSHPPP